MKKWNIGSPQMSEDTTIHTLATTQNHPNVLSSPQRWNLLSFLEQIPSTTNQPTISESMADATDISLNQYYHNGMSFYFADVIDLTMRFFTQMYLMSDNVLNVYFVNILEGYFAFNK